MKAHLARLERTLAGVRIQAPPEFDKLHAISDQVVERNGWSDACVYWKITRGSAPRDRAFPEKMRPTVLISAWPVEPLTLQTPSPVQSAILVEDQRWLRCHLKTLMLLDSVLAKQQALDAGANDAIYHRDGVITEATSSNVFAVINGQLHTHPINHLILEGVTRDLLLQLAQSLHLPAVEQSVTVEQLLDADEVFLSSTTCHVAAITKIDQKSIGSAQPGPITQKLHAAFIEYALAQSVAAAP